MNRNRASFADIKAMLIERLDSLVRQLTPDVQLKGGNFIGKCPWRQDRNGGSFIVWTRGKAAGGWRDYATNESGDVLDLIAFTICGASGKATRDERLAATRWAEDWLGLKTHDPREFEARRAKAQRMQRDAEKLEEEKRRKKRQNAFRLFLDAKPIAGTDAEAYLRRRGVEASAIANFDDAPRFIARLKHWTQREFSGPALVLAMRHPKSGFGALHAIWLDAGGAGKALVDPPKMTLGSLRGAAMRLTKGAGENPPLALCEGPEDGLSVAEACPEYAVWAVAGLNNLGLQIIPAGTPHVVVCADNDWGKPQAQQTLDAALAALAAQGVPVSVARAHAGKDMNDLARLRKK